MKPTTIAATLQPSSDSELVTDNDGDEYGIQNGEISNNECVYLIDCSFNWIHILGKDLSHVGG